MSGSHDDCLSAVISSAATGAMFGTVAGSALANWGDVPKVVRNQSWPALKETGVRISQKTALFTVLGAAFTGAECTAHSLRGKNDAWNGVWGGYAAGAVFGLRAGSPAMAVGSGTMIAVAAAAVHLTGGKFTGSGLFDDGATVPAPRSSIPRGPILESKS